MSVVQAGGEGVGHRVDRVLSFSPVIEIGTPPTPHPQASVLPPPFWFRGEGHSRWRERGWECPNYNVDIHYGTLYICTLWGRWKNYSILCMCVSGASFLCVHSSTLLGQHEQPTPLQLSLSFCIKTWDKYLKLGHLDRYSCVVHIWWIRKLEWNLQVIIKWL